MRIIDIASFIETVNISQSTSGGIFTKLGALMHFGTEMKCVGFDNDSHKQ